jgi:hypothetical protein
MASEPTITVKQLIDWLQREDPDKGLYFGGLSFYRLKGRRDIVQVEFNQTVYEDSKGKVFVENHK